MAIFRKFKGSVILILDDLEIYIVRFVSSTTIHITVVHKAQLSLVVNGRTDMAQNANFVGEKISKILPRPWGT